MTYPPSLSCMPPTKLGATAIVVMVGLRSSQGSPDSHPWPLLVKSSSRSHGPEPNTLKPEHTLSLLTGLFPCPQLRKSYCLSKHFSASNIHPSSHQIPSTSHVSCLSPCSTGVLSASLSTSLATTFWSPASVALRGRSLNLSPHYHQDHILQTLWTCPIYSWGITHCLQTRSKPHSNPIRCSNGSQHPLST